MAFENITSLAESFDRSLTKIAAKEKTSKKSLSKRLEKARAEHQKLSEDFKKVQKEHSGVQARFDELKGKVSAKRKEIISLQSAGQKMDLADASDAIFHQDTNDVSYVIDGKEFHVELDGDGNVNTVPWRDHRKAQKPVEPEMTEGTEETTDEVSNAEDCADPPGEQDAANMDQAMLDDLYLKMTEEKTASYSDLIKKWGADHKEWTESSLLSGDWYKSLGDKVDSFHEDEIPVELTDYEENLFGWPSISEFPEEENSWHHHTECPGKGCVQDHPTGKEPTESSYDPMIDSELEQEKVLESEGESIEDWSEDIEVEAKTPKNKIEKKAATRSEFKEILKKRDSHSLNRMKQDMLDELEYLYELTNEEPTIKTNKLETIVGLIDEVLSEK